MTRAIVIRTYGDPAWTGPMKEVVTPRMVEMDADSMAAVRAECDRLRALNDIRAYADGIRLDAACKALEVKYPPERHGRLYGAILGLWGLLWDTIYGWYDFFAEWNRA